MIGGGGSSITRYDLEITADDFGVPFRLGRFQSLGDGDLPLEPAAEPRAESDRSVLA